MKREPLLTLPDVARTLSTDLPTVAELIGAGELGALEIAPGEFRVVPGDLRRFIAVRRADFRPRLREVGA